jgi:hypothetical protein
MPVCQEALKQILGTKRTGADEVDIEPTPSLGLVASIRLESRPQFLTICPEFGPLPSDGAGLEAGVRTPQAIKSIQKYNNNRSLDPPHRTGTPLALYPTKASSQSSNTGVINHK